MAKVQEAKEIPTVKILDPPQIPDKRSYPPRLLIIFLGTVSLLAVAITWLFARDIWERADVHDERKELAEEVFDTLRAKLPRFGHNGVEHHSGDGETSFLSRSPADRDQSTK